MRKPPTAVNLDRDRTTYQRNRKNQPVLWSGVDKNAGYPPQWTIFDRYASPWTVGPPFIRQSRVHEAPEVLYLLRLGDVDQLGPMNYREYARNCPG